MRAQFGIAQRLGPRIDPQHPSWCRTLRGIQRENAAQPGQVRARSGNRGCQPVEVTADRVVQRRGEQSLLGVEVVEDERRTHAERLGHIGHPGPREAATGHLADGGVEDLLAAYVDAPAGHRANVLRGLR